MTVVRRDKSPPSPEALMSCVRLTLSFHHALKLSLTSFIYKYCTNTVELWLLGWISYLKGTCCCCCCIGLVGLCRQYPEHAGESGKLRWGAGGLRCRRAAQGRSWPRRPWLVRWVKYDRRWTWTVISLNLNSASYSQRDGKWVVAYGLRGEGLVWLIGAVVCLLAATAGPVVRWRGQWMAA